MSTTCKAYLLSDATKQAVDVWLAKYPADQRRSAVIPGLHIVQKANEGHLENDLIEALADYLKIPRIAAFEVATFYSNYEFKPVGKYKIGICSSIACKLRGSDVITSYFKEKLGIGFGETTKDGQFTLKHVECLGACVNAPVIQIGDNYYENLTPEAVDKLLEALP